MPCSCIGPTTDTARDLSSKDESRADVIVEVSVEEYVEVN